MSKNSDSYLERWDEPVAPTPAAMPDSIQIMLTYGLWGGLIVGIIGQFLFRFVLEQVLIANQTLDEVAALSLIGAEQIFLIVGLAITIRYLSNRWKAPTAQTRVLTGLVIGFFYALLVHSLFVGSLSGATANRETFIFFYQDFTNNEAGFAQTWLDGVYRTIVEGTVIGMLTIALQTFAGGILTGLLLDVKEPGEEKPDAPVRPPTQDAFASIVLAILPLLFFVLFLVNSNIYGDMESRVLEVGQQRDIALNVGNFFNLPTLLPLGMIPLMQVLGILWLQSVRAINLHAGSLRTSQIIHGLTMGIVIIPLTFNFLPEIPQRIFILALVGIVVLMAWAYVLVAQFKLREMKNPPPDEVTIWSLLGVLSGVVTIGWLLLDFSGSRILLNLQSYPITLANYAFRGTVRLDVAAEVSAMLSTAFHTSALFIAALLIGVLIASIVVFTPVLWFINRGRRRL
jgi:hypothetical protein